MTFHNHIFGNTGRFSHHGVEVDRHSLGIGLGEKRPHERHADALGFLAGVNCQTPQVIMRTIFH